MIHFTQPTPTMKFRALTQLCAGLLAASLLMLSSGCDKEDKADRVQRTAKVLSIGILVKDPGAADELRLVADRLDEITAGSELSDSIIAAVIGELHAHGKIDYRRAMLIGTGVQELWDALKPKSGVVTLDAKTRPIAEAFAKGIRQALELNDAVTAPPPAPAALTLSAGPTPGVLG